MVTEWQVVTVIVTLVSLVAVFVGCAWRFGSMISKLETLIENLAQTIDRMEEEQKEDKVQILTKIDNHDVRIRQVENQIIKLEEGNNHDRR